MCAFVHDSFKTNRRKICIFDDLLFGYAVESSTAKPTDCTAFRKVASEAWEQGHRGARRRHRREANGCSSAGEREIGKLLFIPSFAFQLHCTRRKYNILLCTRSSADNFRCIFNQLRVWYTLFLQGEYGANANCSACKCRMPATPMPHSSLHP